MPHPTVGDAAFSQKSPAKWPCVRVSYLGTPFGKRPDMTRGWVLAMMLGVAACGGSSESDIPDPSPEDNLTAKKTTIDDGSFDLVSAPGRSHDPIFCEHYFSLRLFNGAKGASAQFDPQLKNCDGEELGHSSDPDVYVLHEVSKDACGGRVLEGTVPWGGAVTRTLRVTDNRKACGKTDARVTAEDLRTLRGETNSVAKYYSIDK